MDGVVVVAQHSGALQHTRSFSRRFDRRHPKSERMNLGALLFALQNFASNAIDDDGISGQDRDAALPAITLFETASERIVLAKSVSQDMLIALFVRPSVETATATSLVRRIALHYDNDQSLAAALHQEVGVARFFREACAHALADEVDHQLRVYGQSVRGFVLLHYAPSTNYRRRHRKFPGTVENAAVDDDDDDGDDDDGETVAGYRYDQNISVKESRLVSPSPTHEPPSPPSRLQKLYASTRSLLPHPATHGSRNNAKPKKNAVMNHADPKSFQRFVLLSSANGGTEGPPSYDPLHRMLDHPQFAQALVDVLQPNLKYVAAVMLSQDESSTKVSTLKDIAWRNFPLPQFTAPPGSARVAINLRLWKRDECLLAHMDGACAQVMSRTTVKPRVADLLNRIEPLARCALKLMP